MRMSLAYFEILYRAISERDTEEARHAYINRNQAQDLDKCYRWDLFYAAFRSSTPLPEPPTDLTDAHIDTALRRIVPPLERKGTQS